jgi:phenylalanine ammonia-lyase
MHNISVKSNETIVSLYRQLAPHKQSITINGSDLCLSDILSVARNDSDIHFTTEEKVKTRINNCYEKMKQQVEEGVPIYGCNTGYGARASNVINEAETKQKRVELAREISESIVHTDVTVGPEFPSEVVRAAMLIRINMLMKGVSAVRMQDLDIYRKMLNKHITPVVNQYGGIGASGDLAHNCRVLSAARGLKGTKVRDKKGQLKEAAELLKREGIDLLTLEPKAGLGLVNGDNFSTALATLLVIDTLQLFVLANIASAMMIEVLMGTDRQFHPLLAEMRPHEGQKEVADFYRYLLDQSQYAYQEMKGHKRRKKGVNVQDAYSLRCISQYHGVNVEKIKSIINTVTINANSSSDNPLWVTPEVATDGEEPWQWVSGGNFIAMHMVEAADSIRKILTQVTKLNDRQLARLVSINHNNGLPPNLSDNKALSQCAFKGVQIQSGMFDVYSSILSMPVSTMFGVHEEMNQDITSHALTSGILGLENLRIARYSTAQNLVAIAQAVDLRGGKSKLSPKTKPVYEFIRDKITYVEKERPLGNDIEIIYRTMTDNSIFEFVKNNTLNE